MSPHGAFICLGPVVLRRRKWGSSCPCCRDGDRADAALGRDGSLSPRLQRKAGRLAANMSFDRAREHLQESLGVCPASETFRVDCERQAALVARRQGREEASAGGFGKAEGGVGVHGRCRRGLHTREKVWRDLKIAVAPRRPAAALATPGSGSRATCRRPRRG